MLRERTRLDFSPSPGEAKYKLRTAVRDESNRFVPYLEGQIPAADEIFAIHADREKRLRVGGNKGLYRFDGGAKTTFMTDNGLAGNDVKTVIEAHEGGIWIGTYDGLSLYQDGKLTN